MHNHIELLKILREIMKNPLHEDLGLNEVLRNFSQGDFGTILCDSLIKSLGGAAEVRKLSKEILAEKKLLESIINQTHTNNEKNPEK